METCSGLNPTRAYYWIVMSRPGEILHLYAFLGAMAGIIDTSLPEGEQDWRDTNKALERLQSYFPAEL